MSDIFTLHNEATDEEMAALAALFSIFPSLADPEDATPKLSETPWQRMERRWPRT